MLALGTYRHSTMGVAIVARGNRVTVLVILQ